MPITPSEQEEEYFARLEFERRKKALAERESRAAEDERQRVLAVAKDRCPKCGAPLVYLRYRDAELDKCSRCQGLWLDCGELDKVITRESEFLARIRRIFA